jgi:hypothetical protein
MEQVTRRQVLASATVSLGLATVGTASADTEGGYPERPDHITASAPIEELKRYQPTLHTDQPTRERMLKMYGWKAESVEHELDAYYYWLRYAKQRTVLEEWFGISTGSWFGAVDEHLDDHEPAIVFVNPATEEVVEAYYTGYHHYATRIAAADANLTESTVSDGDDTHLNLRVIPPHHHYNHEPSGTGALPSNLTGLESWLDIREAWYDRNTFENSNLRAVEDPWELIEQGHWWEEGSRDASVAWLWITLGFAGDDGGGELLYDPDNGEVDK